MAFSLPIYRKPNFDALELKNAPDARWAYAPKDGDLISARGEGKFRFVSSSGQAKKGRCLVKIEKYI